MLARVIANLEKEPAIDHTKPESRTKLKAAAGVQEEAEAAVQEEAEAAPRVQEEAGAAARAQRPPHIGCGRARAVEPKTKTLNPKPYLEPK